MCTGKQHVASPILPLCLALQPQQAARDEAQSYLKQQSRPAGMVAAKPGLQWASRSMRGDRATWLPDAASLEAAGHRQLAAVVRHLAGLQPWLQQQGYDVDGRFSCQLACYPGGGTRYVRHRDRSASVPYREVTCILYLNPGGRADGEREGTAGEQWRCLGSACSPSGGGRVMLREGSCCSVNRHPLVA